MSHFHDPFRAVHDDHDTEPAAPKEEPVPTGTTKEILAWVNEDADRAQRALDAELSNTKPRAMLVAALKEIIEG